MNKNFVLMVTILASGLLLLCCMLTLSFVADSKAISGSVTFEFKFDYLDEINQTTYKNKGGINIYEQIEVKPDANNSTVTKLNSSVVLDSSVPWEFESEFVLNEANCTFFGVDATATAVYCLQTMQNCLRIVNGGTSNEYIYFLDYGTYLSLNTPYYIRITSTGSDFIYITIKDSSSVLVDNLGYDISFRLECDVLGDSISSNNQSQGGTAIINNIHIYNLQNYDSQLRDNKVRYLTENSNAMIIQGESYQEIPDGETTSQVTAVPRNSAYTFTQWNDGNSSPTRSDIVDKSNVYLAQFNVNHGTFDFNDSKSNVELDSNYLYNVDKDGYIQVNLDDNYNNVIRLNKNLVLKRNETWTLTSKFLMSDIPSGKMFTLLGVYNGLDGVYAIQINTNSLRICMYGAGTDKYYNLNTQLNLNQKYEVKLICNGLDLMGNCFLRLIIAEIYDNGNKNVVLNQLLEYNTNISTDYVVNCNTIGNSISGNINQGSCGVVYSMSVSPEAETGADSSDNTYYNNIYMSQDTSMGYVIANGQQGTMVSVVAQKGQTITARAYANLGYMFKSWNDGTLSISRSDVINSSNVYYVRFVEQGAFDYQDLKTHTKINSFNSIDENGNIIVTLNDNADTITKLDKPLRLLRNDSWTLTAQFMMNNIDNGLFTLLGMYNAESMGSYAIQIDNNRFRICMYGDNATDKWYTLSQELSVGKKYELKLINWGLDNLNNCYLGLIINEITDDGKIEILKQSLEYNVAVNSNYVVNCNAIGNVIANGANQNSAGIIYSILISPETDVFYEETEFNYRDDVNGTKILNDNSVDETGKIVIEGGSEPSNITTLNKPIELHKDYNWILTSEFELNSEEDISLIGVSSSDLMGTYTLQIGPNSIRFYTNGEFRYFFKTGQLSINTRYKITLVCNGMGSNGEYTINLTITNVENKQTIVDEVIDYTYRLNGNGETTTEITPNIVIKGDVIGKWISGNSYNGGAGYIYNLNILTEMTLDLFIIAGQSNSVCYTGRDSANLDVLNSADYPLGIYEYRPSIKDIQPLSNPVGEELSIAGNSQGYTTGGTWFSSMAKSYKEGTGRSVVILPAGVPGATTKEFYNTGNYFNGYLPTEDGLIEKYLSFKEWIDNSNVYSLGRIMLIWHQGESGTGDENTMLEATKKVFEDISAFVKSVDSTHPIDQIFFSRISLNQASPRSQVKSYNDQFAILNDTTEYVLVAPNAYQYYWQDVFADEHHYDMNACNDFGKKIGEDISFYYTNNRTKPNRQTFEDTQNDDHSNFINGLSLVDDSLILFDDVIDKSKFWLLANSTYNAYAKFEEININSNTNFTLQFDLKLGDNLAQLDENSQSSTSPDVINEMLDNLLCPILGSESGISSINVGRHSITIKSQTETLELTHQKSPMIQRPTTENSTCKDIIINTYKIQKIGKSFNLYVNEELASSVQCSDNFNITLNILGKNGDKYLEGIISNFIFELN